MHLSDVCISFARTRVNRARAHYYTYMITFVQSRSTPLRRDTQHQQIKNL